MDIKHKPWYNNPTSLFWHPADAHRSIKAVDTASGKSRKWRVGAHEAGVSCLLPLAPNQVGSGDDDGCVKLWDARQPEATAQLRQHTDYVADFAHQVLQRVCLLQAVKQGTRKPTVTEGNLSSSC